MRVNTLKRFNPVFALCLFGALGACTSQSSDTPVAAISPPAQAISSATPTNAAQQPVATDADLSGLLRQGMSYSALSEAMRANGWVPVNDASCLTSFLGENAQRICAEKPSTESCAYCSDLPGLSTCSADGYCAFVFRRESDSTLLDVSMSGELEQWRHTEPDVMFAVSGWRLKK